jgi:N-acetylglucosaminyldiphosphoundecaprenol N-acetyl-beta-D-mannosaminyltransferase
MQKFPEVNLLNTKFHQLTVQDLIQYIVDAGKVDKKTIVGNVNVRAINFTYQLPWYRDFINNSDVVFCDGVGVILGAKVLGYDLESKHRMTCPDYIESLALACEQQNVSLFLLAGKPGVTDKAIDKLLAIAPNLRIEGHHGYFDKDGNENKSVIEKINQFKPDVLYIGFGMPLQERWILDNIDKIEARVFLPLGACLDFYTDSVYRGPRWMTDNGLEWLTRLITEPTRLWERYIVGNPLFFYRVFIQRIAQGKIPHRSEKL